MKPDKVFVRHQKFLNEPQTHNRDRQSKRGVGDKKKYAQKSNKIRESVKQIIESYEPIETIPTQIESFITKFPKFFKSQTNAPEKDLNDSLNQFVILNAKKYLESLANHRKQPELLLSSSDPDWNSDEDIDGNMKSREIKAEIIEKISEKMSGQPIKKHTILKRHQKQFLQDYYRAKRLQEQQEKQLKQQILTINQPSMQKDQKQNNLNNNNNHIDENQDYKKNILKDQIVKPAISQKNIWSQYQQKQVNSFIDMGFMTKINDNDEDIEAELAEDDGMFCDDEDLQAPKSQKQKSSSSSDDQDIFGDEQPTTSIKISKTQQKVESQKKIIQGTVVINDQTFTKIANKMRLSQSKCSWIISNDKQKYKVSLRYMDIYYRQQRIYEILPYISLNNSDFVRYQQIETEKALEIFRKQHLRSEKKPQNNSYKRKSQFRQKNSSYKI